MDLNLTRSRLTFNTVSGKEGIEINVQEESPMNPYFEFAYSEKEPELGPEYIGYLGEIIGMQKKNV